MKYKFLRALRVLVALLMLAAIVAYFIDLREKVPQSFAWLEKIQFVGAVTSGALAITLAFLAATLLFGRVYCSVICPLGILQDLFSWLAGKCVQICGSKKDAKPKEGAPKVKKVRKPFAWKNFSFRKNRKGIRIGFFVYAILAGFIGLFYFGLIEPYGIFGRIAVNVFRPINVIVNNELFSMFQNSANDDLKYAFFYVDLSVESVWAFIVGIVSFVGLAYIAGRYGRLYCNTVCPVGSFLGFLSQFSFFKTRIDASKCISCGLCEKRCKSSCIDAKNKTVDNTRCVVCFDCFGACKKGALSYGVGKKVKLAPNEIVKKKENAEQQTASTLDEATLREKERVLREIKGFDRGKREFIALSALAGVAAVAKFAVGAVQEEAPTTSGEGEALDLVDAAEGAAPEEIPADYGLTPYKQEHTIMPPGAPNRGHYMHHCVGCQLCVAKCPAHILKPGGFENGLLGFMQPIVEYSEKRGFCNFDCTICGDVCPTGAILPLTVEKKHVTQMGHVVFIKENCIVYAKNEHCGACSEHCPTQAVQMVPYGDPEKGLTIPETHEELCVGCGGCEHICPARPYRAIYIEGHPEQTEATPPPKEEVKEVENVDFGF
ncbi:MAG: 4Fe-4S dicluster domain-containing protein [Thermoguttaceae bacterium]|nr:4Fe-4S dicluster domain-containing protein [Thermoguttaceae bacterium]